MSGEVWAGCPAVFLRKCTVGEIDSVNAARDATIKLAAQHADENSKSFAEVEQERLQRQLLAERDADYDSSLGTLCRVQVHTDSHVTCIQDLWAVRNSTPSKRRSSILTIKCNLGILGRLSMNKFLLLSRPRNDGVRGSKKRGA